MGLYTLTKNTSNQLRHITRISALITVAEEQFKTTVTRYHLTHASPAIIRQKRCRRKEVDTADYHLLNRRIVQIHREIKKKSENRIIINACHEDGPQLASVRNSSVRCWWV